MHGLEGLSCRQQSCAREHEKALVQRTQASMAINASGVSDKEANEF